MPLDDTWSLRCSAGVVALAGVHRICLSLEQRQFLSDDPLCVQLIHLLQGPLDIPTILQQTCPPHAPKRVRRVLEELYAAKIVRRTGPQFRSRSSAAFWDMLGGSGPQLKIAVESALPNFGAAIENLLTANGVEVDSDAGIRVVVTDDYLRPEMAALSRRGRVVLPVKPVGHEIWIGPPICENSAPCWECLEYWLRPRRWAELSLWGDRNARLTPVSIASLPSTLTLGTALAATTASLIAAGAPFPPGRLLTFDCYTLRQSSHAVIARRNCAICAGKGKRTRSFFFAALRSERCGILEGLQCSTRRIGFVYLAHAKVPLPLPRSGVRDILSPLSADGKGRTRKEAVERCTMEAIERYSAVFVGDETLVRGRIGEVEGIAPNEIALYSDEQLRGIPEPFDANATISWARAAPLRGGAPRYVPAGSVYLAYSFQGEPVYADTNTNGCAAGDEAAGATLRALLESIERDATAIWWYNRLRRPAVDLDAWNNADAARLRAFFTRRGRTLDVLDLTNDLGVPVYAAVSADGDGRNIFFGCGAHPDPTLAATAALMELAQFWYWIGRAGPNAEQRAWLERGNLEKHFYLAAANRSARIPARCQGEGGDALHCCLDAIEGAGLAAYKIDLTRPELGVPVVRVVAPGLRHNAPRFAPGRLFDVPVKMGWLSEAPAESELNEEACPF